MRGGTAHTVTCNLDALLLENEALRHQVRLLREELAMLQVRAAAADAGQAPAGSTWRPDRRDRQDGRRHPAAEDPFGTPPGRGDRVRSWRSGPEVTTGSAPGITPQLVRQWGEALARHPRWRELRLGSRLEGDPSAGGSLELGLQALLDDLRARSHDPALELEDALDRRSPGLGSELRWALSGPASRTRAAVRACFALHGPRAADRLSRDPQAAVEELLAAIAQLEAQARQAYAARREREAQQQAWGRQQDGRRPGGRSWGWSGAEAQGGRDGARTGDHRAGDAGFGGTPGAGGGDAGAGGAKDDARAGARDGGSGSSRDSGANRARSAGSGGSRGSRSGAAPGSGAGEGRSSQNGRPATQDPQQLEALGILELSWGASRAAVKAAHRRLVKVHHPDMGGDAESFRRINAAYQLLIA